jgi:hypothetical protein
MIEKFGDIVELINNKREQMVNSNPLFKTFSNHSLPWEKRMAFMPYMLFFAMGFADVITLVMRINKPEHELTWIERKINDFVNEDNFHYNFFLHDLQTLNFNINKFSTPIGVIRHMFSEESIDVRQLIYSLGHCIKKNKDPITSLAIIEILEAGLYDFFTTIYKDIVKTSNNMPTLRYYGDEHVNLEKKHTVTSWFSGSEVEKNSVNNYPIPQELTPILIEITTELMQQFDKM